MVYGLGWFPTVVVIRLSQPPAGDWPAGDWAELRKKEIHLYSKLKPGKIIHTRF